MVHGKTGSQDYTIFFYCKVHTAVRYGPTGTFGKVRFLSQKYVIDVLKSDYLLK